MARPYWSAHSWDRTQVPKPFSRIAVAIGEPIDVPAGVDDEVLERSRAGLEQALGRLADRAGGMLRGPS